MALPLVLVHGGAHGAWCWAPTVELLDAPALAVDLPPKALRGVPAPERIPDDLLSITLDDFATSALSDVDAAGHRPIRACRPLDGRADHRGDGPPRR